MIRTPTGAEIDVSTYVADTVIEGLLKKALLEYGREKKELQEALDRAIAHITMMEENYKVLLESWNRTAADVIEWRKWMARQPTVQTEP